MLIDCLGFVWFQGGGTKVPRFALRQNSVKDGEQKCGRAAHIANNCWGAQTSGLLST